MFIRVVDLETTGTEPPQEDGGISGVCEIGFCDLTRSDERGWTVLGGYSEFIHPGCAIPPEASAIHQIVDRDVEHAETWPAGALKILSNPVVDVFAAHQVKFERQWLDGLIEKPWICTYKAALRLWPEAPAHGNQVLRHWQGPRGLDRIVADISHRAWPDAYVTAHLLRDMLNDGASVEQLIEWTAKPALLKKVNFGKHRGALWKDVPTDYLMWVLAQDFDEDTMFTAGSELERRSRPAPALSRGQS